MADQFKPTLAGLARKCFGEKKRKKEHVLTTTVMQILNQMFMPWMNRAKAGEKRSKQKERIPRGGKMTEKILKRNINYSFIYVNVQHILSTNKQKMEKETC